MASRDLKSALKALSRDWPEQIPADVDARLQARLATRREGRGALLRWMAPALAVAAATAVLLLWLLPSSRARMAGFELAEQTADFEASTSASGTVEILRGSTELVAADLGSRLTVSAGGQVRKEPGAIRVLKGVAVVSVRKRAPAEPPMRVLVSGGSIEVLGTKFTVVEDGGAGAVTLHEGRIRFLGLDQQERVLTPGESLKWPLLDPPEPAPETPEAAETIAPVPASAPSLEARSSAAKASTPKNAAPTSPSSVITPQKTEEQIEASAIIKEVDALRSRGRYREARDELEKALRLPLRPSTWERLSYELGMVLTLQLRDGRAACAHWLEHARRCPNGVYEADVRAHLESLRCEPQTLDSTNPQDGRKP